MPNVQWIIIFISKNKQKRYLCVSKPENLSEPIKSFKMFFVVFVLNILLKIETEYNFYSD